MSDQRVFITEKNFDAMAKTFERWEGKLENSFLGYSVIEQPKGLKRIKFEIWGAVFTLNAMGGTFLLKDVEDFVTEWELAKKIVYDILATYKGVSKG